MKFYFKCIECGYETKSFDEWFKNGQKCKKCKSVYSKAIYSNLTKDKLKDLLSKKAKSLWHYFDLLPLNNKENITTLNEGAFEIERWKYLEKIAKDLFDIECEVRVLRNDKNPGTYTFKDLAGSVVASVLKENNIKDYVVSSTGNIASAFSRYLSINNITTYAFLPKDSSDFQVAEIRSNGGNVCRVDGDYHIAKEKAKDFAKEKNFLLAASGIDITRIEAKKTMIYEMLRQLKKVPNIYIQALSGGTGPIGIYKGAKELMEFDFVQNMPKLYLVQSDKCAPMADGYQQAKKDNFTENWQEKYPIYHNPQTKITTIATGNPSLYKYLAPMVKESKGDIVKVNEDYAKDTSKLISILENVKIGPAASIAVEGFFKALKDKFIKNGDVVVINIGEGVMRSPDYLLQFANEENCKVENIVDIKNKYLKSEFIYNV